MRYASRPSKLRLARAADYLRHEGFAVGMTHTGFVAVDEDGVVFIVSPFSTSAQIYHPILNVFREEYAQKLPETHWFQTTMNTLLSWAKDSNAKEPARMISASRRPVPSRQGKPCTT